MSEIDRLLGERSRILRRACRMTQVDIATVLNLHRPAISRIEAGQQQLTAAELLRLTDYANVPPCWLFGFGDNSDCGWWKGCPHDSCPQFDHGSAGKKIGPTTPAVSSSAAPLGERDTSARYFVTIWWPHERAPRVDSAHREYNPACDRYQVVFDDPGHTHCYIGLHVFQHGQLRLED